jgi:type IX secretion system PorP/SprF family membrane protein
MNQSQLSFGATFSILQYMINTSNLNLTDKTDSRVDNNKLLVYVPDVNLGVYYTDQHKFIGLSILQLSQASFNLGNYGENLTIYRHFYLIGGYKFELDNQNVLEPSLNIKASQEWLLQMDATLKYIYDNKFWIGIGFRTGFTIVGSIGIKVKKFYVGYAYDYSSRGLLNNSYGSHELMIALKLGDNTRRYKWIERY